MMLEGLKTNSIWIPLDLLYYRVHILGLFKSLNGLKLIPCIFQLYNILFDKCIQFLFEKYIFTNLECCPS